MKPTVKFESVPREGSEIPAVVKPRAYPLSGSCHGGAVWGPQGAQLAILAHPALLRVLGDPPGHTQQPPCCLLEATQVEIILLPCPALAPHETKELRSMNTGVWDGGSAGLLNSKIPSRLFPQNVGEQGFQACPVEPSQDSIHRQNNKMQCEQHPWSCTSLAYG